MNKSNAAIIGCTILCISLVGCDGKGNRTDGAPDASSLQALDAAKARLELSQKEAAQTAQTYKAMDNSTLLDKLAQQSAAKKEPFNSLAYRELKGRADVSAESLAALVRQIKNGNALLPLLLLREQNEKAYLDLSAELRAAVLTDALQSSKTFNTWGLPPLYLEAASRAMLEVGQAAHPALKRLLADTRSAPLFGSQEYMQYQRYKYRVCDYALFFLETSASDAPFKMPVSPGDRDALIQELSKPPS